MKHKERYIGLMLIVWIVGFIPVFLITDNDDLLFWYALLPFVGPFVFFALVWPILYVNVLIERLRRSLARRRLASK